MEFDITNNINSYQFHQNYPNPFNPNTSIRFDLKEKNFMNLSVYNIPGEKVEELINEILDKGSHEIKFDGSKLASGIYICKFDVKDTFTDLKKMVLLK